VWDADGREYIDYSCAYGPDLRPRDSGHLHLSLKVEGIDEVAGRMSQAAFKLAGPIQQVEEAGGFRVIYTYGFDGLVIELMDFSQPCTMAR
jgi:hypothetical protein